MRKHLDAKKKLTIQNIHLLTSRSKKNAVMGKSKPISFKMFIKKAHPNKNRNANFCKNGLCICIAKLVLCTLVRILDLPQKFSILHHIFYLIIVLCIHASSFVWNKNMNGIFLRVVCVSIWNTLEAKK